MIHTTQLLRSKLSFLPKDKSSEIPSISITPSRRLSISSPIRFTRTFSDDSLDSLERSGRKELRRQKMMHSEELGMSLLSSPSTCPHLGVMGRSRTEPTDSSESHKTTPALKRSTGDLSRDQPSPTKKVTLSEIIGLTIYQQRLLLQSWPNIYSTGCNGQFASSIYSNLCNKNSKARQLFTKANSVAMFNNADLDCTMMHARVTLELIDTIIRSLDGDHTKMTAYIVEIGKAHRPLRPEGLTPGMWDELGDAIVDSVRRFDSVRKHKELRRAWLALVAYITDNLKQGQIVLRASSSYEICECGSPKKTPSTPS